MSYSASIGTTGQLDEDTTGGAGQSGFSLGLGTGQQGHTTVDTSAANPFVAVYDWLNTPFKTPLSPWSIMLLVGVVLVSVLMWNMILFHVRIAAEAL